MSEEKHDLTITLYANDRTTVVGYMHWDKQTLAPVPASAHVANGGAR